MIKIRSCVYNPTLFAEMHLDAGYENALHQFCQRIFVYQQKLVVPTTLRMDFKLTYDRCAAFQFLFGGAYFPSLSTDIVTEMLEYQAHVKRQLQSVDRQRERLMYSLCLGFIRQEQRPTATLKTTCNMSNFSLPDDSALEYRKHVQRLPPFCRKEGTHGGFKNNCGELTSQPINDRRTQVRNTRSGCNLFNPGRKRNARMAIGNCWRKTAYSSSPSSSKKSESSAPENL